MRKFRSMIVAVAVFAGVLGITESAVADAPVDQVIAACDRMAAANPGSCSYSADKKTGDITGCVVGGKCFYCAADGSRTCQARVKLPDGKFASDTDAVMDIFPSADLPPKRIPRANLPIQPGAVNPELKPPQ